MRRIRFFAAWLLVTIAMRAFAADAGTSLPVAYDLPQLAQQARAQGMPLILLVSLPDCSFCEQIRKQHLAPLVGNGTIVSQIDLDSAVPLIAFDGKLSPQRAFAHALGVRVAPTVLFLDANGNELADRLTGALIEDFYGAYLDNAIGVARKKLHGEGVPVQ